MNQKLKDIIDIYKTVISGLPYAACIHDKDLRYIYANKAGEKLSGISLEEPEGKKPQDIFPKDLTDKLIPIMKRCLTSGENISERIEFDFNGNETVLSLEHIPIVSPDGDVEFIMIIIKDWTEHEERRSEAMANSRLASIGHMAANITHEINNPLQLIQLRLYRLEEMIKSESKSPLREGMLEEIQSIYHTTDKINKIVDSVRRQSKQITSEVLIPIYVSALVEEAITYTRHLIEKSQAELILDFKNDAKILCNPIEVEQVLINLITNACDAILEHENPFIKISSTVTGGQVLIRVQDSGHGVEKSIQKSIMEPFFTTKQASKGTGIGLNLSKALIKRNKGELKYLPHMKNTTFEIALKDFNHNEQ